MSFVKTLILGSTLLASVLAQGVSFTEWPTTLTAGQPATLKWTSSNGAPVTITLRKGASGDLHDVQPLTSDATSGEFTWTPPADLPNGDDYAFQVAQGDQINYSSLIPLSGGTDSPGASVQEKAAVSTSAASSATEASGSSSIPSTATSTATSATSAASETSATKTVPTSTMTSASESEVTSTSESASSSSAHPSITTPFSGTKPSLSTSASHSVQTGAADHVAVSLGFGAASIALALIFQ